MQETLIEVFPGLAAMLIIDMTSLTSRKAERDFLQHQLKNKTK